MPSLRILLIIENTIEVPGIIVYCFLCSVFSSPDEEINKIINPNT
jgi:hypothetical protein